MKVTSFFFIDQVNETRQRHGIIRGGLLASKGPFTQMIFVAQLNGIFVPLKLRFHRDISAVCYCKTSGARLFRK